MADGEFLDWNGDWPERARHRLGRRLPAGRRDRRLSLEKGDLAVLADSIEARLKHVLNFLDAEDLRAGGVFGVETKLRGRGGQRVHRGLPRLVA